MDIPENQIANTDIPKKHWLIPMFVGIALLIIVGVAYFILGKTAPVITKTSIPQNEDNKHQPIVLLLVEKNIAEALKYELDTYSKDVLNELGFRTVTKLVEPTDDVLNLKEYVLNTYRNDTLSGVLIVGNVPTGYFYHPDYVDANSVFNSEGLILGDSIYQDIFGACIYSTERKAFSYKDTLCQPGGIIIPPYWVGRLTPNSSNQDSVTLLKNYFKRNHDYRSGQFSYQKNVLIYTPLFSDRQPKDMQGEVAVMQDFSLFGRYKTGYQTNQLNFIDPWDVKSDQKYLTELNRSHNYEIILFNGHGAPTFHQKNLKPENIGNASTFLGLFLSCSVGRFTTKDYLAGQYLFTDSLVVIANSVPVFAASQAPRDESHFLTSGKPVFETLKISPTGLAQNILGDPTLRMRYDNTKKENEAFIDVDRRALVFSDAEHEIPFKIKNTGTKPLYFTIKPRFNTQKQDRTVLDSFSAMTGGPNSLSIPPQDETQATLMIYPWDQVTAGTYHGSVFILSNDTNDPVIEIPFEIQKK
ncbi:MAG: hypothetical protein AAB536_01700 [Patescibacteria group bacterium]